MSKILYSSLVKLPKSVENTKQALELIYRFVQKPDMLHNIESEIIYVDNYHINIVRYFDNVEQYQQWMFSSARNQSDEILMKNGFYLYTKQAHNETR